MRAIQIQNEASKLHPSSLILHPLMVVLFVLLTVATAFSLPRIDVEPEQIKVQDENYRPEFEIPVVFDIEPPRLRVIYGPYDERLLVGQVVRRGLVLINDGDDPLRFFLEAEIIADPDDEDIQRGWITVEPDRGEIPSRERVVSTVTIDAADIQPGDYNAEIWIISNDPNDPPIVIDINIVVFGIPRIALDPEEINLRGIFHGGFDIGPDAVFDVLNVGNDELFVGSIEADVEWLSFDPDRFFVDPDERQEVEIDVDLPFNPGEYDAVVTIRSNDPVNEDDIELPVHVVQIHPPVIAVEPGEIEEFMFTGEVVENDIHIANEGDVLLRFAIEHEIIDEPGDDIDWLSYEPDEGEVEPGEETVITVTFDAQGARGGYYEANLIIDSNDPENPEVIVNLIMDIPAPRWFPILWPEDFGFPDLMDFNVGYRDIFPGQRYTIPAIISNEGSDALIVESIECDDEHFRAEPDGELEVEAGEEVEIEIVFETDEASEYEGVLAFVTNDPDEGEIEINIHAEAFPVPRIAVEPRALENELFCGEIDEYIISIQNIGEGLLRWRAEVADDVEWVALDSVWGVIEPDRDVDIFVTVNAENLRPGEYEADIVIANNDPETPEIIIPVSVFINAPEAPWEWWDADMLERHSLTVPEARLDGIELETCDWIGVFNEGDYCAGAGVYVRRNELEFFAYENNPFTNCVDGFGPDDQMFFRVYKTDDEEEYPAHPFWREGPQVWVEDGESILELDGYTGRGQRIELHEGWNFMSLNVTPPRAFWPMRNVLDVILMLEQLVRDDHVILFKDECGRFYTPEFGFNCIMHWNLTEGYMIKVDADVEGFWFGEPIAPDADIPIAEGWNLIAYYPDYELPLGAPDFYAFEPILDHLLLVKDEDGHFCSPEHEFSNIPPLNPGKGYHIKVNADVVLNYPPEPNEFVAVEHKPPLEPCYFTTFNSTATNMSLLIENIPSIDKPLELGVFNNSGLYIGATVIEGHGLHGMAIWGDDPTTEEIDGAIEYESLTFKLWDGASEIEVDPIWLEGNGTYMTDGLMVMNLDATQVIPKQFDLQAYPNPFNNCVRITYTLVKEEYVKLVITDLSGRETAVMVEVLQKPGQYQTVFNTDDWTSGVYIARLNSVDKVWNKKLVCLK